MLKRCKIKVQKSEQETYKTKVCKYHSYGSSKRGSSCHFVHSLVDCKEYMNMGKCFKDVCRDRHRRNCKFFKTLKGCNKDMCPYIHRSEENNTETSNEIEELNTIINKLKSNIQEKDSEIISQKKVILKLNEELNDKEKELSAKDKITRPR